MPALPVFTDRCGRIIGDNQDLHPTDNNNGDESPPLLNDADLPGVHTDKTGGDIKIPRVDPVQEELPLTPAEMEHDVDLDFAPAN